LSKGDIDWYDIYSYENRNLHMLKLKIFVDIFAQSIHIRCFPR
jgi:hypothetical protein